nr:chemotaxis protein CheD [uncultured Desulfuromonas sp.]
MRPDLQDLPRVYLKPGDLQVTDRPKVFETVLGSCVAVALVSPSTGHAAMCHAMLPTGPQGELRYVDAAVHYMIKDLKQRGVQPSRLVAKLFGGADMFYSVRNATPARFAVGQSNLQRARQILEEYRVEVRSHDTGGQSGRKVVFFTDTGQVYVKHLKRQSRELKLVLPYLDEVTNG